VLLWGVKNLKRTSHEEIHRGDTLMERGTLGLTAAAAVAVWAFLSLTSTHDRDRAARQAELAAERAAFDRDFARATGAPQEEQEAARKRAAEAEKIAKAAREEAERQAAIERQKRLLLEEAAESDIRENSGPDLSAAGERILKNLEKGYAK
jgi:hypothetical protein